ncbi:MAG TPA: class I adenylate-forming enzyme family protein [Acidimicrobiales bacterium]
MSLAEATARLTAPGALFEMEEVTIRGVPTRTWKSAPTSLRDVLALARGYGDADFVVYEGERTTFAQHHRAVATLAHRLIDRFGVQPGDRVAIAMRNLPEWVIAFWATVAVGAVAVPLNAWWAPEELRFALADCGAVVVFADVERTGRLTSVLGALPALRALVVADEHRSGAPLVPDPVPEDPTTAATAAARTGAAVARHTFNEVLGTAGPGLGLGQLEDLELPDVVIGPDDDATIFYTSGTTGRPKGAVGTHRNAASNLMNLFFLNSRSGLRFGTALTGLTAASTQQSVFLLSVPLFHVTGCQAVMITYAASGGRLVMMHHFEPERALTLIEAERVTTFGGVPAMVLQVLSSPELAAHDLSSVRSVSFGGAPAPVDLVRRITERFPDAQSSNGYGLTETSATTTMNSGPDYLARPDSVGPPVPVSDVAVVPEGFEGDEPEPRHLRASPAPGELWVKGPQVVRGYWEQPEETAGAFTRGWFRTGDVGRLDEDGFVYLVDRATDVVIRGGENVYPAEVESALFEHPAVADCAVLGVAHPVLGEEVGAVVVLQPGAKVAADELAAHVRLRLAPFKVPTRFWFRAVPLPRNPAGKVLKRVLRDDALGKGPDMPDVGRSD